MFERKIYLFVPIILFLFAAARNNDVAQSQDISYSTRGDYSVGARALTVEGDTPLDATLWYPALNEDGTEETIAYPYETNPDMSMGMEPAVAGHALSDAPFDLSDGPYPLVVLSHGYSLGRTSYAWLAEHLASRGFVVVAPQHFELVDETLADFWQAAITRPQEVVSVLDYVEMQAADGGPLAGLIDTESVAVVGHSYGGYTALVMAGARFDIDGMEALCAAAADAGDPNAWLCDLILPSVDDMAALAGLDETPIGLWPSRGDARVDAIVTMAGDAYFFNEAGLAEVTIPVMALGGTADTGTPYAWGTEPTYDYVSSESKVRVALEDAEHMVFAATCDDLPWFTEIGMEAYCSDPVWDVEEAHDVVNHYVTAYLLAELKNDSAAAAALAPDATAFANVTYDAEGYGSSNE